MAWSARGYHKKIYVQYGLELIGWPDGIPFTNLSNVTGIQRISTLLTAWQAGTMKFVPATLDVRERAKRNPADTVPSANNNDIPLPLDRSDLKRHRSEKKPDQDKKKRDQDKKKTNQGEKKADQGRKKTDRERLPSRDVQRAPKWAKLKSAQAEARAEAAMEKTSTQGRRSSSRADDMPHGAEDPSDTISAHEDERTRRRVEMAGLWDLRKSWTSRAQSVPYRPPVYERGVRRMV